MANMIGGSLYIIIADRAGSSKNYEAIYKYILYIYFYKL